MRIRVHVRVGSGILRGVMIASVLIVPAGDLCSESVSLQAYYPAPSGAYTQLITTQNTFLARDSGSLGIGTSVVQDSSLKLAVLGNVGINKRDPAARLDIAGTGGTNVDFISSGKIQTGEATNNAGAVWFNSNSPAASGKVGMNGSTMFGIYNGQAPTASRPGWPISVSASAGVGNVGINTPVSGFTLDVNGPVTIRDTTCDPGSLVQYSLFGPNTTVGYVTNPNATCPAGTYATWANGLMTNYQHEYLSGKTVNNLTLATGTMFCCPCPNATCISTMP